MSEHIDIEQPIREICERLGVDPNYVARLDISPTKVDVTLYRGSEGRCKGPKFVWDAGEIAPVGYGPSSAAYELVSFEVKT